MARIEGFRVQNFKVLKDVEIGKSSHQSNAKPLTPLTAVVGKNGTGKSALFDAFGFLADCLKSGVEEACEMHGRGGFSRIRSQGMSGPIAFEVRYRQGTKHRPITYRLEINLDASGRPFVQREQLQQRRKGQTHGRPFSFLRLKKGVGRVWKGEEVSADEDGDTASLEVAEERAVAYEGDEEAKGAEMVHMADQRKLGIAVLGSLQQHPRITAFRRFIESWYLSYFSPDAARSLPLAGPQRHLNVRGDNLGNVVQFMAREHPERFERVLRNIAKKIPGVEKIGTEKTQDGRLLLRFDDQGFQDPFYAQQVSDGTLKMFAYLLLLEDPDPPPLLCIEEPENGLYHKLLEILTEEFRHHVVEGRGSQIFITTHHPYVVDALEPDEVWILEKKDGFSTIKRASDDETTRCMVEQEIPLGELWYSGYLEAS